MNCEIPGVQAGMRKGRGTRDQIANISCIIEKAREFQKNIYFRIIDYAKAFDCVDQKKTGKFLKGWEYHSTWPSSWEICMQVRKQQLEVDMEQHTGSKLGKEYVTCLFNFPAEYIIRNARLDEAQSGIKISGRNINNLRYADDVEISITSDRQMALWQKAKKN